MRIESIWVYPIKGAKGCPRSTSPVERRGLRFDRRWMLVDESGLFLSQRKIPAMATLSPTLSDNCLTVSAPGQPDLTLDILAPGPLRTVTVWKSEVQAATYPKTINDWFSEALNLSCELVLMPESTIRPTNPDFSQPGDHVSFADGYPLTLASIASLNDLNERLPTPIPMTRFRPNLVAAGIHKPWIEETWDRIRIGPVFYRMAKPCGRCQVTTIDQETGAATGDEPLRTLAKFRKHGPTVDFSVNLIPESAGHVSEGDEITPLATRS
jgi:uncharacterized protein YcbX